MKKPRLYTSRPPSAKTPRSTKRPQIPAKSTDQPPLSSHPWLSEERVSLSSRMKQVEQLSSQITDITSKMEKWLNTFSKLSTNQDPKVFQDFFTSFSKGKRNAPSAKNKGSGGGGGKAAITSDNGDGGGNKEGASFPKPHSEDGDSLYDLINAPGMGKIVDHVMKQRGSKRKRQK